MVKMNELKSQRKAYEKPNMEITVFEVENICYESGIFGDPFGMDGIDIN